MSDGCFSISAKSYVRENIENHEPSERMIWHQLIHQNSKHSGEAENTVLLDAESFLGDIDSITLNETSTNVSDHVAGYICHKETETLWLIFWSNSLVWRTKLCEQRSSLQREVWKSFDEVTWHCCRGLRSAWRSQQCYQAFSTGLKKCRIVILQKFLDSPTILCHNQRLFFIWLTLSTTASLVHKQRT